MTTIKQHIEFWAAKSQILNENLKSGIDGRAMFAIDIARDQPEKFMYDAKLMSFLYSSISDPNKYEAVVPVLYALFTSDPQRSIRQKNLMVTIRRLAVDGHREESQEAATILLERNDAKSCLASKHFLEMLVCIASFDIDGTVTKMLNRLEGKEPELCEKSDLFKQARESNAESIDGLKHEEQLDLVAEEKQEKSELVNVEAATQASQPDLSKYKNLWAHSIPANQSDF